MDFKSAQALLLKTQIPRKRGVAERDDSDDELLPFEDTRDGSLQGPRKRRYFDPDPDEGLQQAV